MSSGAHYDLRSFAAHLEKGDLRPRKALLGVGVGIGLSMVIGGLGMALGWIGTPSLRTAIGFPLLLLGTIIAAVGVVARTRVHRAASEIDIYAGGFALKGPEGSISRVDWSRDGGRVELLDWRSIPRERRSRSLKEIDFILYSPGPLDAALSREVVDCLLRHATQSGLSITGWETSPSGSGSARAVRFLT